MPCAMVMDRLGQVAHQGGRDAHPRIAEDPCQGHLNVEAGTKKEEATAHAVMNERSENNYGKISDCRSRDSRHRNGH